MHGHLNVKFMEALSSVYAYLNKIPSIFLGMLRTINHLGQLSVWFLSHTFQIIGRITCYTVCVKVVHKSKQESMHDILINIFLF